MTKVKIVKCSGDYWYKIQVGEVFKVKEKGDTYKLKDDYKRILKSDCEIVSNDTREEAHVQKSEESIHEEANYSNSKCLNCRHLAETSEKEPCNACFDGDKFEPKEQVEKSCKYKIGDKVTIKHGLENGKIYGGVTYFTQMKRDFIVIEEIRYGIYYISTYGSMFSEEMIDGLYKEQQEKPKKIKLRMSEDFVRDIQHRICFDCRDRCPDICKACIYVIMNYVKGEK